MSRGIKASLLTETQLKMLDIGAPVIISCETLDGELVQVRLQSQHLESSLEDEEENPAVDSNGKTGSWQKHGVYVAIMPNGPDYGC